MDGLSPFALALLGGQPVSEEDRDWQQFWQNNQPAGPAPRRPKSRAEALRLMEAGLLPKTEQVMAAATVKRTPPVAKGVVTRPFDRSEANNVPTVPSASSNGPSSVPTPPQRPSALAMLMNPQARMSRGFSEVAASGQRDADIKAASAKSSLDSRLAEIEQSFRGPAATPETPGVAMDRTEQLRQESLGTKLRSINKANRGDMRLQERNTKPSPEIEDAYSAYALSQRGLPNSGRGNAYAASKGSVRQDAIDATGLNNIRQKTFLDAMIGQAEREARQQRLDDRYSNPEYLAERGMSATRSPEGRWSLKSSRSPEELTAKRAESAEQVRLAKEASVDADLSVEQAKDDALSGKSPAPNASQRYMQVYNHFANQLRQRVGPVGATAMRSPSLMEALLRPSANKNSETEQTRMTHLPSALRSQVDAETMRGGLNAGIEKLKAEEAALIKAGKTDEANQKRIQREQLEGAVSGITSMSNNVAEAFAKKQPPATPETNAGAPLKERQTTQPPATSTAKTSATTVPSEKSDRDEELEYQRLKGKVTSQFFPDKDEWRRYLELKKKYKY